MVCSLNVKGFFIVACFELLKVLLTFAPGFWSAKFISPLSLEKEG